MRCAVILIALNKKEPYHGDALLLTQGTRIVVCQDSLFVEGECLKSFKSFTDTHRFLIKTRLGWIVQVDHVDKTYLITGEMDGEYGKRRSYPEWFPSSCINPAWHYLMLLNSNTGQAILSV
jgi:hypothetical protein